MNLLMAEIQLAIDSEPPLNIDIYGAVAHSGTVNAPFLAKDGVPVVATDEAYELLDKLSSGKKYQRKPYYSTLRLPSRGYSVLMIAGGFINWDAAYRASSELADRLEKQKWLSPTDQYQV